ncbi:MAG: translation initiation factor IF-2 subunit beta [Candidatus Anstonellales archaeon]
MDEYEKMLEEAYAKLPEKKGSGERLEIPKVASFTEGNKTIVKNFRQICDVIRREPAMLSKYLSRELAAPVEMSGDRLIVQRKVLNDLIQSKVDVFIKEFVMCKECGKPDTHIETIMGVKTLICEACGARRPVRA